MIYHITHSYPPDIGGMELCVGKLTRGIAEKGFNLEVILPHFLNPKEPRIRRISFKKIISFKRFSTTLMFLLPLYLLKKLKKGDIVHIHSASIFIPEVVALCCLLKKARYIMHIHLKFNKTTFLGNVLEFYKLLIFKPVLKKSAMILCPTDFYREIIAAQYHVDRRKIFKLPYGIDTSNFHPGKMRPPDPAQTIDILNIGRFSRQKNLKRLIMAFKIVVTKFSNAKLHLVGEGESKKAIKKIVKQKNLTGKVLFHDSVPHEDIGRMFKLGQIFAFSSDYESFGIVLLEAMASGLPLVCVNIRSLRWLKKEGIGLFSNPEPQDFANCIIRYINDPQLYINMRKKGLLFVERHSWETSVARLANIYRFLQSL